MKIFKNCFLFSLWWPQMLSVDRWVWECEQTALRPGFNDPELRMGLFTSTFSGCSCSPTVKRNHFVPPPQCQLRKMIFFHLSEGDRQCHAWTWRFGVLLRSHMLAIVLLPTDLRGTAVLWKLHGYCVKCHLHCPAGDIIQDRVYNFMKDL